MAENRTLRQVMDWRRISPCGVWLGLLACCLGCGGERLVPVTGRVTLAGRPVPKGYVWFVPDPAKGTIHTHYSTSNLDSDGRYELTTFAKPGAPLGWYKVVVYATKNEPPSSPAGWTPQWLVPVKYTTAQTTDLEVEVVASPAPGAYEFDLADDD